MSTIKLDTELQAWVYLNRVIEGPSRTLAALLEEFSVQEIAHGVFHGHDWIGPLAVETAARRDWLRQDEDIAAAKAVGARLITPASPEWPTRLFTTGFEYFSHHAGDAPSTFSAEALAPHALWVRGDDLAQTVAQAVTVVGTRAVTRYGAEATRSIVAGLARHQWTIVSGGALGVDTVAHEAALDAGVPTLAVAACGIDHSYPVRNRGLFDRIATRGAIISEFPPGATPQRHRFLTRNRLAAALGSGTVVVEAAFRSGALNTLNWAEALGKVTMAVPGPITSAASLGCHQRIQDGRAQLVTSADEIRELLSPVGSVDATAQYELDFAPSATQSLPRNELRVYDATPLALADAEPAEAIARDAGLSIALTVHLLVALEQRGLVRRIGSCWMKTDEEATPGDAA